MKTYSEHIISSAATLKQGLEAINKLGGEILCLFVVDDKKSLVGTLTDGDIRRALITGVQLSDPIEQAMQKDFAKAPATMTSPSDIRDYRARGITLLPCVDENGVITKVYDLKEKKSVLPIDAVLMAGGKGIRLRPLTEHTPKPLLKVGDKAIIDHNIDSLIQYGVENIYVNVNYLAEQIESHFADDERNVAITCVREPKFLGTMGSVKYIDSFSSENVLVMNSDLFTNIDFEEFYLYHDEQQADITVAAIPYSVSVPYGIFELENDKIKGLLEKPTYNYYANGGIYLVKKKLFDLILQDTYLDATEFIEIAIARNHKVVHFPIIGYWVDIGKHEDYKKVQEFVRHMKS